MVLVVLMNDSCCIRIVSCSYCFLHIIIDGFYDFVALAVFVDLTLTELADGFGGFDGFDGYHWFWSF